jgi:hypothetical protein
MDDWLDFEMPWASTDDAKEEERRQALWFQAQWLLELGLCPDQRFIAELKLWGSQDHWGEYDCGIDLTRVIDREAWSDAYIAEIWHWHLWGIGSPPWEGIKK